MKPRKIPDGPVVKAFEETINHLDLRDSVYLGRSVKNKVQLDFNNDLIFPDDEISLKTKFRHAITAKNEVVLAKAKLFNCRYVNAAEKEIQNCFAEWKKALVSWKKNLDVVDNAVKHGIKVTSFESDIGNNLYDEYKILVDEQKNALSKSSQELDQEKLKEKNKKSSFTLSSCFSLFCNRVSSKSKPSPTYTAAPSCMSMTP